MRNCDVCGGPVERRSNARTCRNRLCQKIHLKRQQERRSDARKAQTDAAGRRVFNAYRQRGTFGTDATDETDNSWGAA